MSSPPFDLDAGLRDSVKASAIGGGGMVARLLQEKEQMAIWDFVWRAISAAIVTWVANYYFIEQIQSSGTRAIACALVGVGTPEIIRFALQYVNKQGAAVVSKAGKGKPKKKGGKRGKK